jgi:hypothetical protein
MSAMQNVEFTWPSGHAMGSVVSWAMVARALSEGGEGGTRKLPRAPCYAFAWLLVCCTSASRVALGVHFPTDILAGWLGGCVVLSLFGIADFHQLRGSLTDGHCDGGWQHVQSRLAIGAFILVINFTLSPSVEAFKNQSGTFLSVGGMLAIWVGGQPAVPLAAGATVFGAVTSATMLAIDMQLKSSLAILGGSFVVVWLLVHAAPRVFGCGSQSQGTTSSKKSV